MQKTYLKSESGIWFYLQYMVYLQWIWWEWEKKTRKYIYTRKIGLFADWSPLLPYMADGTAHYAEKVGDTQQLEIILKLHNEVIF